MDMPQRSEFFSSEERDAERQFAHNKARYTDAKNYAMWESKEFQEAREFWHWTTKLGIEGTKPRHLMGALPRFAPLFSHGHLDDFLKGRRLDQQKRPSKVGRDFATWQYEYRHPQLPHATRAPRVQKRSRIVGWIHQGEIIGGQTPLEKGIDRAMWARQAQPQPRGQPIALLPNVHTPPNFWTEHGARVVAAP